MAQNQALQQLIQQSNVSHVGMSFRDQTSSSVLGMNVLGISPLAGMTLSPQFSPVSPMFMNGVPNLGTVNLTGNKLHTSHGKTHGETPNLKVSFQEPEQGDLWSTEKARGSSRDVHHMSTRNHIISPPPTLLPMGSPFSPGVTVK
ncbi:hypothetical protein Avbf_07840 [Armadillidium vulgare]|nr:hypothetical protein Avbf_15276 [Armadillidium vulgare]RXG69526.1 hypothetical protein Avbf_07840 [Armadillidium vulgare]